jgi:flavin reductase (DIM6/NTAB) family NADH-FMN oxidoreductase RutF
MRRGVQPATVWNDAHNGRFGAANLLLSTVLLLGPQWRVVSALSMAPPPTKPIIPPLPALSVPVWSLATTTAALARDTRQDQSLSLLPPTSMNIVTFTTAVSVASPKLWMVSLYLDTLTKDAFLATGYGVLQLLRPSHKMLIPILGQRSGYDVNHSKRQECRLLGYDWVELSPIIPPPSDETDSSTTTLTKDVPTLQVLPDCASYVHLQVQSTVPAGDHIVALCQVVASSQWDSAKRCVRPSLLDEPSPPLDSESVLYTGLLRQEGIL